VANCNYAIKLNPNLRQLLLHHHGRQSHVSSVEVFIAMWKRIPFAPRL